MSAGGTYGIYVHVPFCRRRCPYCNFVLVESRARRHAEFVAAVCNEIAACGRSGTAETIYFGGGTPSLLAPEEVEAILGALRRTFDVAPGAEVTLEANPDELDAAQLAEIRVAGVCRISIGAQAFDDDALRAIGRTHSVREIVAAVEMARAAGFDNVNLDLMYAIPGTSLEDWRRWLDEAIALGPQHVSVYGLTLEAGTAMAARPPVLPAEEEQRAMYLEAYDRLCAAGYEPYELSNYARPGFRSRHNEGCWARRPYLGFGPGAHSFLPPERWANASNVPLYIRSSGRVPHILRERLAPEQEALETLWLTLRRVEGIEGTTLSGLVGSGGVREAEELIVAGWLEQADGRVRLTREGRVVADEVVGRLARHVAAA